MLIEKNGKYDSRFLWHMDHRSASVLMRPAGLCLSIVPAGSSAVRCPVQALTSTCVVDMVVVIRRRINWKFRRFNEPGHRTPRGPRVVGPQKIRQENNRPTSEKVTTNYKVRKGCDFDAASQSSSCYTTLWKEFKNRSNSISHWWCQSACQNWATHFDICRSRSQGQWSLLSWHAAVSTVTACHTSGLWRVLNRSARQCPSTRSVSYTHLTLPTIYSV